MYKFKLFKRDVLVNGRYKRSFECLDNGIVHIIDYKNDMVDGSYKIYGSVLTMDNISILKRNNTFRRHVIEYIMFSKNVMKLDYYVVNYDYYINRSLVFTYDEIHRNRINKDKPKFSNYKDVIYN